MKKRIIPIVLVLAAAVGGLLAFRGMGHDDPNRIVVSGNIELEEVNIGFKTAGRLIERTVDEGDMVHKGQIIARLDRDQLVAQQQRETAGVRSSEFQLDQAETAPGLAEGHAGGRYCAAPRRPGRRRGAPGRAAQRLAAAGEAGCAGIRRGGAGRGRAR